MADELLSCPFCGGEARISRAHQNKMLAMGEVPTDEHYLFTLYHDCANGITICWTYKPKDALIAAWNRRTTPPPAADEREAVAQWCSGCHEVRSVDCYRAGCPKSDTERRAAEILAAEENERARIVAWLDETAWLLERDYFGQLRYFSAACQDEAPTDWTPDNLQALRFARRIDAERFASREATDCIDIRVVEHMWCAIEHGAGK